jgi:hypothetical protein
LRQVTLPTDWTPWQRATWLDAQAVLWGELGIVLDGNGGPIEAGADAVSNLFADQSHSVVEHLVRGGDMGPDDYVAAVNAVVFRVSTPDIPAAQSTDRADGVLGGGGD